MQISITGHHVEITPPLKQYVESKFSRLERHFERVIDISVILDVEKLRHKAEATIHTRGKSLFADAIADDMYAAIDALTDKLDRQIRKHKEKQTDHHRHQATPNADVGDR
jgi:putative sigma-54 modulation protein